MKYSLAKPVRVCDVCSDLLTLGVGAGGNPFWFYTSDVYEVIKYRTAFYCDPFAFIFPFILMAIFLLFILILFIERWHEIKVLKVLSPVFLCRGFIADWSRHMYLSYWYRVTDPCLHSLPTECLLWSHTLLSWCFTLPLYSEDKYADLMPVLSSLFPSQDVFLSYEVLSDSRLIIAIDLGWGPALVTVYQESSFCLNLKPETREKSWIT